MPELVVATFNVHAGIDGWGRPFDVVAACGKLDADVLFLEENWIPEKGESLASLVGQSHGYEVHEAPLSDALVFEPSRTGSRWGPTRHDAGSTRPLFVNDALSLGRVRKRRRDTKARLGSWGIAMLSRVPVKRVETVELGRLSRDSFRLRAALFADLDLEGSPITVIGTHLAHFVHGSPLLVNRLRRKLPATSRPGPRRRHELLGATRLARTAGLAQGRASPHLSVLARSQPDRPHLGDESSRGAHGRVGAGRSLRPLAGQGEAGHLLTGSPSPELPSRRDVTHSGAPRSDLGAELSGHRARSGGERGEGCWRSRFPVKDRSDRAWAAPGSTTRPSSSSGWRRRSPGAISPTCSLRPIRRP